MRAIKNLALPDKLLFEYIRTRPCAKEILCSCVPGEGSPQEFYESLEFIPTGEMEGSEVIMRRGL